jgi:DNA-directed RNA polymerases I, II, and III subunit RPABC5
MSRTRNTKLINLFSIGWNQFRGPTQKKSETMLIPIRCFTCNKTIGNKWDVYVQLLQSKPASEALVEIGMTRYCCKRMFLTHIDLIDRLLMNQQIQEARAIKLQQLKPVNTPVVSLV